MSSGQPPDSWMGVAFFAAAAGVSAAIDILRRSVRTWLRIQEKQAGLDPSNGEDE